jgi:hypothetical protein
MHMKASIERLGCLVFLPFIVRRRLQVLSVVYEPRWHAGILDHGLRIVAEPLPRRELSTIDRCQHALTPEASRL